MIILSKSFPLPLPKSKKHAQEISRQPFSFDVEWIPDPRSAIILHNLDGTGDTLKDNGDAFEVLWADARKDDDLPDSQPYLKTILCKIVSIAGILRERVSRDQIVLKLVSLPVDPTDPEKCDEKLILHSFMKSVGRRKPQLVGFNSSQADIPIIIQRAIVNGLSGLGFFIDQTSLGKASIISIREIPIIQSTLRMHLGNSGIVHPCIKQLL